MLKVQWYPGHMTKVKRKLEEQIKTIDAVIELRDARIPKSSNNPEIKKIIGNKEHIIVLNKMDLSCNEVTIKWLHYFKKKNIKALAIKSIDKKETKKILPILNNIANLIFSKRQNKGLLNRSLRCIVVGIPNVGKSSFINSLASKKIARTANKPGVTKGNQWITITNKVQLLDTPGILWPKFENNSGFYLAVTGAISDLVYDKLEAALLLIDMLGKLRFLKGKYDFYNGNSHTFLKKFSKKRGLLNTYGIIDIDKGAILFMKDYREGKIGHFPLEMPPSN